MTTALSSLSSVGLAAFSDELEKIAADDARKEKFKRWAKNTALIAAGAGTGAAIATALDHYVVPKVAPTLRSLQPQTKAMIALPLVAGGSLLSMALARKIQEERKRTE